MKQIYTSVDLGSDTIKVVVCELFNNKLNLLAASSIKSGGIKRGLITDVEEASRSLKEAITKVEEMLGIKITKVIASLPSYSTDFEVLKEKIDIEKLVTKENIEEVVGKALENSKVKDKELVTVMPIDFMVDNEITKSPRNLEGSHLSVRLVAVHTPRKNLLSVVKLFEYSGIEVVDVTLNSIGDMYARKEKTYYEKIGAIINIGHETTTISLYNKGILVKSSVLNIGGKNITKDIAYIYQISTLDATNIKKTFALAHKKYASINDTYEVENKQKEKIKIKQYEVSEVAMARIEEILNLAKKEIKIMTKNEIDYILVTGGTSNMSNFNIIAEEILGKKARVESIKLIGLRHNKYSSAIGNIVYFVNKLKLKGYEYTMIDEKSQEDISSPKKISNDTMFGKVYSYFFGE